MAARVTTHFGATGVPGGWQHLKDIETTVDCRPIHQRQFWWAMHSVQLGTQRTSLRGDHAGMNAGPTATRHPQTQTPVCSC